MGKPAHDSEPSAAGRERDSDRAATKDLPVGGGVPPLAGSVVLIRDGEVL